VTQNLFHYFFNTKLGYSGQKRRILAVMNKLQKIGFLSQPIIFLFIGIVFIAVGLIADNNILKYIGFVWTPLGVINLILILILFKKSK
jgi:hypothetical protein